MMNQHEALELEQAQASAEFALRALERKYFAGVEPVSSIEVANDPTFSSCYIPKTKAIKLNFGIARFPVLGQFLILHELVHHKLSVQNPNYPDNPYGEAFRRETRELFNRGAYDKLL